jgi:hypothetical protein
MDYNSQQITVVYNHRAYIFSVLPMPLEDGQAKTMHDLQYWIFDGERNVLRLQPAYDENGFPVWKTVMHYLNAEGEHYAPQAFIDAIGEVLERYYDQCEPP